MTFITLSTRFITACFVVVIVINVFYFRKIYNLEEQRLHELELQHLKSQTFDGYIPDASVEYPDGVPYHELDPDQKVAHLLRNVQDDANWFLDPDIAHKSATTPLQESASSELYYDPRVTLAVYLQQLLHQPPPPAVPFAWSDWVDLTALNPELDKPDTTKLTCSWLQSKVNKPTNHPDFCINKADLSRAEIDAIGVPYEQLPGFVVRESPRNKIPNLQSIMQAKSHLLTYAELPLKLVFLTANGTYSVDVSGERKDIRRSGMLRQYLEQRGVADHTEAEFTPVDIMHSLRRSVEPRLAEPHGIYGEPSPSGSREFLLQPEMFHYGQDDVHSQIQEYHDIMRETVKVPRNHASPAQLVADWDKRSPQKSRQSLHELMHSLSSVAKRELYPQPLPDPESSSDSEEEEYVVEESLNLDKLSKQELNHYQGLVNANHYSSDNEPVYYKLSTLYLDEENSDNGWHYEWRFFNGAFNYIKDRTWSEKQLEAREKIILERLLRNWFRFSKEMGIVSWISHGPLLAWYWNGFMFPFDIDIDIQMPIAELNKLTKNHNMTLVVEDVEEGFGKYLIDCSTYLHNRDVSGSGNYIDARFIDIDTGVYIDITALSVNNETPPPEYNSLIRGKKAKGESVELYMDRRKHWLNFEKLNPLRLTLLNGVPAYVPNDIMSMLNFEYSQGTTAYYFNHYFYVPIVRLWLQEDKILSSFEDEAAFRNGKGKVNVNKLVKRIQKMDVNDKVRLLESDKDILIEYEKTNVFTSMHEYEKLFMLDYSQQLSVLDLQNSTEYHKLAERYELGKPLMESLFGFEYYDRGLRNYDQN